MSKLIDLLKVGATIGVTAGIVAYSFNSQFHYLGSRSIETIEAFSFNGKDVRIARKDVRFGLDAFFIDLGEDGNIYKGCLESDSGLDYVVSPSRFSPYTIGSNLCD